MRYSFPAIFLAFLLLISKMIYAEPSVVTFDSEHICYVNGEKFFPIGIFNTGPDVDAANLARDCGFNTIHSHSGGARDTDFLHRADADLNGDGRVDEIDYVILSGAWYTAETN